MEVHENYTFSCKRHCMHTLPYINVPIASCSVFYYCQQYCAAEFGVSETHRVQVVMQLVSDEESHKENVKNAR